MNSKQLKLIKRDLIFGFNKNKYKFLLVIVIFSIFSIMNIMEVKTNMSMIHKSYKDINLLDIIFMMVKGSEIQDLGSFTIPIGWFLISSYISYLIGSYCYDDISEESSHVLVRMRNRKDIWISKIVWMISTVVAFYCILFVIILITGVINGNMALDFSNLKLIYKNAKITCTGMQFVYMTMILYLLTSITMSALQMLLSLIIKPAYMYLVMSGMFTVSFMVKQFILPSQASLMLRQHVIYSYSKMNLTNSIVYNLAVCIIVFIVGLKFVQKFDILKSQNTD